MSAYLAWWPWDSSLLAFGTPIPIFIRGRPRDSGSAVGGEGWERDNILIFEGISREQKLSKSLEETPNESEFPFIRASRGFLSRAVVVRFFSPAFSAP